MTEEKRNKLIAAINARLTPPTPDNLAALDERGFKSWGEYIVDAAENAGMKVSTVFTVFDTLGPNEAFDGFVTNLEDYAEMAREE